jgi:hypothetical protein
MKMNNILKLINEIDGKFPVNRWVIDSVHVWPLIRFHLYFSFFTQNVSKKVVLPPPLGNYEEDGLGRFQDLNRVAVNILRSFWKLACARVMDSSNSLSVNKHFDVLLLNYSTYMTKVDGLWYSKLCDPFVSYLSKKGMSCLMLTGGYECYTPRFTKSVFIQPYLTIFRMIGMLSCHSKHENFKELKGLNDYVKSSGLFLESFSLIEPVIKRIKQIKAIAKYFKMILRKTKPKIVFVSCYYSTESMGLILACHRLGIPSIDIQHGLQGDLHVAYAGWNHLPDKGYELLPKIFWCWSEAEASTIERWSKYHSSVHRPVVGGNLFINQWLAGDNVVVKDYDKIMVELKASNQDRIHILFSLNGNTENELIKMIKTIKGINKSGLRCFFWVRLHPVTVGQKEDVRKILIKSEINNIELDNATELPLYAILRHIDIHITEFSSVIIEAESFYVPSIVVNKMGVENFPNQFLSGWAISAYEIEEVINGIKLQLKRRLLFKETKYNLESKEDKAFDYLLGLISLKK